MTRWGDIFHPTTSCPSCKTTQSDFFSSPRDFFNYPEGLERSLSFHHGGAFAWSGYSVVGDFAHCNHHISCRNNQTLSFYASAVKEGIRSLAGVGQVRFSDESLETRNCKLFTWLVDMDNKIIIKKHFSRFLNHKSCPCPLLLIILT